MFEFHCINSTAYDNRNSPTTGKYWLIKAFEVLKGIQDDVVLDGTVYLDETYFTKVRSKLVTKDGKKLRGISRNKIGVGVFVTRQIQFLYLQELLNLQENQRKKHTVSILQEVLY